MAALTVEIKATEIDTVKEIIEVIKDVISDERIPTDVREELKNKVSKIIEHPPGNV